MKVHIFRYIIFTPFVVLLGCKSAKLNNKEKTNFKGRIVFEVSTKIENEERFNKELNSHIKIQDSLYKLQNPNDTMGSITPGLRLYLDPREDPSNTNTYYNPQRYVYEYSDTSVTYSFLKFKVVINTTTNNYKRYNIKTNKLVKDKKYLFYEPEGPYKEIIYKDSTKNIHGFNCYKVLVSEKSNGTSNSKKYKEMYVTEDINSLYHPAQIRKELLKKYYPLQVKIYSDFLKDKVTYFNAKSIELMN